MAALRPGFAERAGRPGTDARPDLQARRHAGGLGGAGRLGAPAQSMIPKGRVGAHAERLGAYAPAPFGTCATFDICHLANQRTTHGIGMMKAIPMRTTIARHRNSSPVPL